MFHHVLLLIWDSIFSLIIIDWFINKSIIQIISEKKHNKLKKPVHILSSKILSSYKIIYEDLFNNLK